MSLAPFKAPQLLDQRAVIINQCILVLVQLAHSDRLPEIFPLITAATVHFASTARVIYLSPWSKSDTLLSTISRSHRHNEALFASLSFRTIVYQMKQAKHWCDNFTQWHHSHRRTLLEMHALNARMQMSAQAKLTQGSSLMIARLLLNAMH